MLHGVFPAFITPFSKDGLSIDLSKIKPICDALLNDGVDGLFVCGTTGEGPLLTAPEKISMIETVVEAMNGRGKLLAQIGCGDFPGTMHMIQAIRSLGVDAISLLQPWFFHCDDEAQYNYIARIAEALNGFPLYLYNLPGLTGNNLNQSTVEKLRKNFSNIRGLKESGTPEMLQRWAPYQSSRFEVICGNDTQMLRTLCRGGTAVVASTANVIPKTFRGLVDAVRASQWEKAEQYQDHINQFVDVIDGPNVVAYIKACLTLKGLDAGYVRPPNRNLNDKELQALKEKLVELEIVTSSS